jgi:hypothetical protein
VYLSIYSDVNIGPRKVQEMYYKRYAQIALDALHSGMSLSELCRREKAKDPNFPSASTIRGWYVDMQPDAVADDFTVRYALARRAQGQVWADEILTIADEGTNDWMDRLRRDGKMDRKVDNECVQRSKLRIEARKWLLSKLHPDTYAEVDPPSSMQIDLAAAIKGWQPKGD